MPHAPNHVVAGGPGFRDLNQNPQFVNPQRIPPTGLIGSEQARQAGLRSQLGLISQGVGSAQGEIDTATGQARKDISEGFQDALVSIGERFNQAQQPLQPFAQAGAAANEQQAALSGARGTEAQAQAFQNFQSSPGQEFLREEAERATMRGASRTGGLSGNVLQELQRQAIGLASQDFQNQFGNLGSVANRGLPAAQQQAQLFGQSGQVLGGAQQNRGISLGNVAQTGGRDLSNLALQGGLVPAQAVGSTASQVAQDRLMTGQQIAIAAGGTTAGLGNLQNQLGAGLTDRFGQGSTNIANTAQNTGQQSAQLRQNLASILQNIQSGGSAGVAALTNAAAQFDAAGPLGTNTAIQNSLGQLLQLLPQTTPPSAGYNFGGGSGNPSFNAGAYA